MQIKGDIGLLAVLDGYFLYNMRRSLRGHETEHIQGILRASKAGNIILNYLLNANHYLLVIHEKFFKYRG